MTLQVWCLVIVCLFSSSPLFVSSSCDQENSLYLIRSAASPMVVDAGDGKVTVQHLLGHSLQLWKFKSGSRPGLFFIINSDSGKVLDVNRANGNRIVLAVENHSLEQQWTLNSNGRIANAAFGKNLDIVQARFVPGNHLIVWEDNGNAAQDFIIKEKLTCCPAVCANLTSPIDPEM